jgi:hypothetical protein
MQAFDAQYRLLTGQQMPLALAGQLMHQIQTMDPTQRNNLAASMPSFQQAVATFNANPNSSTALQSLAGTLSDVGATYGGATGPGSVLYNTMQSYSSTASQVGTATTQNLSTFRGLTGRDPSPSELSAISGLDPNALQSYIDALPSPVSGMTFGSYNQAYKNMQAPWMENFGKDPSNPELKRFGGWSPTEIQDWINTQPSKQNPSMTIGQRNAYVDFGDKESQKLFGTTMDSRMVDLVHQTLQNTSGH